MFMSLFMSSYIQHLGPQNHPFFSDREGPGLGVLKVAESEDIFFKTVPDRKGECKFISINKVVKGIHQPQSIKDDDLNHINLWQRFFFDNLKP